MNDMNIKLNQHPVDADHIFDPLSVPDMFMQSVDLFGDAELLDFMGRKYSYNHVAKHAKEMAKSLQNMGMKRGDRVGLFLPNVPHYVVAYYAIMMAGGIVVNFSPLYTCEELAHQVEDSGTRFLFTVNAASLLPNALKVLEISSLEKLIVGTIEEVLPPLKSILYRLFKRSEMSLIPRSDDVVHYRTLLGNDGVFDVPNIDPVKDIVLLQYTGGTTGTPKGAMLSHQNITANARQINSLDWYARMNNPNEPATDKILGVLPFFHVFANACVLNRTINNGGSIFMLPRFDGDQALDAIDKEGITSMPGVPTMYRALLDNPKINKTNFSTLRACVSGGAPLSADLKRKFEAKTGSILIEGYGLTESSGVVSCNPYEGEGKVGTIGIPVPGTKIRLVDKEDPSKEAPKGGPDDEIICGPGELTFAGPQVMQGYWQRPDADKNVFMGEYLRTGDVATIDRDGFVKIVDRIKDMISVGGFKVFPSQIEEILYKHICVREALVIGVPDDYLGERPKAYIALEDDSTNTGAEIMEWLNGELGKHERVVDVVVKDELPKTMIGKLDRKALREAELGKAELGKAELGES